MSDTNEETTATGGEDLSAIVADLQKQLDKVNSKNRELVGEKQAAKQAAIDARQQAEDAATSAAERSGDVEALKKSHASALKTLQDKLDGRDNDLRTIRVDNAIKDAITQGNVKPEMARAVTALLTSMTDYQDGQAMIEGKSIQDYAKEYLGSDEGKHFVRASTNSGGGARGSDGSKASADPFTPDNIMSRLTELADINKVNPAQAKAIAERCGVPGLI